MIFNAEVTLGNVLQILAILGGGMWFMAGVKSKMELLTQALSGLDRRITSVETSISALNTTTIELARQEVRLDSHAHRLKDLEAETRKRTNITESGLGHNI